MRFGYQRWIFSPGRYDRAMTVLETLGEDLYKIDLHGMAFDISRDQPAAGGQPIALRSGEPTAGYWKEGRLTDSWGSMVDPIQNMEHLPALFAPAICPNVSPFLMIPSDS